MVDGHGGGASPRGVSEAIAEAVTHFNARRYWHAYECWRTPLLAAEPGDRDFFEGLMLVTSGLLHLQRRNARASRLELDAGVALLRKYLPAHADLVVAEVVDVSLRHLDQLKSGTLPYLIGPVIKFTDAMPPESRARLLN